MCLLRTSFFYPHYLLNCSFHDRPEAHKDLDLNIAHILHITRVSSAVMSSHFLPQVVGGPGDEYFGLTISLGLVKLRRALEGLKN